MQRQISKRQRRERGEGSVYFTSGRGVATLPRPGQPPLKFYGRGATEAEAKAAAQARRKDYLDEVAQGLRDSDGGHALVNGKKLVYLGDWLDHWLDYVVKPVYDKHGKLLKGNQPTTWQNYSYHVRTHLKPLLGGIKLVDLRTHHVEAWYKQLTEDQGVAASSAYEARRTLVTALNAGLKRRHETRLTHNAASAFALKAPTHAEKLPPDPEEITRILAIAEGEYRELAIHLGLFLGLRREEIAGLQWRDFDLAKGEVLIRRRVVRIRGQGLVVRGGSKMHDDDYVADLPLDPEEWRPKLQAHRQRVLEYFARFRQSWTGLDPRDDNAFLFVTEQSGELLDPNMIYRFVKGVFRKAGCEQKTLHTLRHDFAGMLFDSDVPLLAISKLMRHANIEVTAGIYTHMTAQKERSSIGKAVQWVAQAKAQAADGTTG